MTIRDFAKKYGLTYAEVYRVSAGTASRQDRGGRMWMEDFREEDLKRAVRGELERALKFHGELANRAMEKLARLNGEAKA